MGFFTNRDDVKNKIQAGGWTVAFGRELTYEDAAEGLVAAGVSIFTDETGAFMLWLDGLINESLTQMGQSIDEAFVPAARHEAEQFAKTVISDLLQGRASGEQLVNLFHFNFKAGVAQFNGQNTQWVPNVSAGAIGSLITSGDTGGTEQNIGPPVISYCPYVGLRFNPAVEPPPPPQPPQLRRIQWIADNGVWYDLHEPGVWNKFLGLQAPQFKAQFLEFQRDANYVYLRDHTPGSNLEIALGSGREFYHYTDGNPGWHPDIPGHWKA